MSALQSLRTELAVVLEEATVFPTKPRWRRAAPAPLGKVLNACLQPTALCLLCEHQQENEAFALAQLYQNSAGACLSHFQRLLPLIPDDQAARWLTELQIAQWSAQEAELEAYRWGAKSDAWQQALAQLSGTSSRLPESRF